MRGRDLLVAAGLLAILLGAAAARFIDLQTNPGGLFPDEAAEALAGRDILRDPGYRPVFLPENAGREATYAYSLAIGFAVAGDNINTMRSVAALWGVLGALGAWALGRRFGTGAGLAAAAWVGGSLWLIAISRDGMRNTITPFFCAAALTALLLWYERPSRARAVLAGAAVAICGLYTYQALQLLPLLVVVWLVWLRRAEPQRFAQLGRGALWAIATFLAVGAPMILYALTHPQAYFGRAVGVSAFNAANVPDTDTVTHIARTLGMFAFVGDPNVRHNVGAFPMLSWPLVGLAIVGLVVLLRQRRDGRHALILLSIPVFLIPPLVATEGAAPHFLRSLGLAIPVAIVIGLGAQDLARRLASRFPRPLIVGAFAVVFLVLGVDAARTYLIRPEADRRSAFTYDMVALGQVATPADIVIMDPFDAFTIRYVHDDPQPEYVDLGVPIDAVPGQRVLATDQKDLQDALGAELAQTATAVAWDDAGNPMVWAVTVP